MAGLPHPLSGSLGARAFGWFLAYFALAVVLCWPALSLPGPSIPGGDHTDALIGFWVFTYVSDSLSAGTVPWNVSMLNFPSGGTLLVLDPMGALFVAVLAKVLGVSGAMQALAVFRLTVSGILAHGFARRWLRESCGAEPVAAERGAWLAGLVYATAPVLAVGIHNGNTESFNGAWLVASAWATWELALTGGLRRVVLAALALFMACLANWYSGVCAFLFAGSFALLGSGAASGATWRARWSAVGLGLVLVLPMGVAVRQAHAHPEELSRVQSAEYLGEQRRGEGAAAPGRWIVDRAGWEKPGPPGRSGLRTTHCLGLLASLSALVGWWHHRRRGAALALAAVGGALLAMGPRSALWPYSWLEPLPGFDSLSLLWRLGQAPILSVALLAAAWGARSGRWAWVLLAGIGLEILVLSPLGRGIGGVDLSVEEAVYALPSASEGAVVTFPMGRRHRDLLRQTVHGHHIPGALDAVSNARESEFWKRLQEGADVVETATDTGIRYLVVIEDVSARTDPWRGVVQRIESEMEPLSSAERSAVYALY